MGVPADSRAQLAVSGDISVCHNQETAAGVAGGQWVEARGAGRCCAGSVWRHFSCHNQETAAGVAGGQWVEARGAGRCCTTRRTAPPPPPTPRKNRLP